MLIYSDCGGRDGGITSGHSSDVDVACMPNRKAPNALLNRIRESFTSFRSSICLCRSPNLSPSWPKDSASDSKLMGVKSKERKKRPTFDCVPRGVTPGSMHERENT